MTSKTPIYCPHCGRIIGYQEDFMFMVMTSDIKCQNCDKVAIHDNNAVWWRENEKRMDSNSPENWRPGFQVPQMRAQDVISRNEL